MDMQNVTLITLCWELYEQGIPKARIAARLGKHRETIHVWIKAIQHYGLLDFLDRYEQAKKGERRSRQVDALVKRWVWSIREREYLCCGQKIQYFLEREHGITSRCPRYMRYWLKNMSFAPAGRKTTPEGRYLKPRIHVRSSRWIASTLVVSSPLPP